MQRSTAEDFLDQALGTMADVSPEVRTRLLAIARRAPSGRARELTKAFQEVSRG